MIISFFEEFPTKEHLDKIKFITWPTKIYLAAKSQAEFNKIKASVKSRHVKGWIYWPVLEKKEGYWISPFCKREALERVFQTIRDVPVMLDLELPTRHNPLLYLTQLFNFWKNKELIKNFVTNYENDVYLAEYYPEGKWQEMILKVLGLHYPRRKVIKMIYHSMHHFDKSFIISELWQGKKEFQDDFLAAFGVIYPGIIGREPLLTIPQLKKDLKIAKKIGIKEIIIYRLSGLTPEYADALKQVLGKP